MAIQIGETATKTMLVAPVHLACNVGSGSVEVLATPMVAALLEGRNFIGIEKNEDVALFKRDHIDYIAVARRRLLSAWQGLDPAVRRHLAPVNLIREFGAG